jgi:hypothetical protein
MIEGRSRGDFSHSGQFTLNQWFSLTLSGTAGARIVVKGAGASQTTITQQNANQNVMNVAGTYFSFYNMTFTGGSRGVRLFGASPFFLTHMAKLT